VYNARSFVERTAEVAKRDPTSRKAPADRRGHRARGQGAAPALPGWAVVVSPEERERHLRSIAETAQDFLFVVDGRGLVRYVNPWAAQAFRTTPERIVGRSILELFPAQAAGRMLKNVRKVIRTGLAISLEMAYPMPVGLCWLDTRLTPLRGPRGGVQSVLGVSRDISRRKQAEQEVQDAKNYLEAIVTASHDGILVFDEEGRFEFGNQATFRLMGWPKEELLGEHFLKVVAPDMQEFVRRQWHKTQAGRGSPHELDIVTKDGTRRTMFSSLRPMSIAGHRKYCVVTKDITEYKRAQAELRKAHDELEVRVRERTAELRRANEELRNQIAERCQAELALHAAHLQLLNAREAERRRLALDLHDSTGQKLIAAHMRLRTISERMDECYDGPLHQGLKDLSAIFQELIAEIRQVSHGLYPPALVHLGLCAALRELAGAHNSDNSDGLAVAVSCPPALQRARFAEPVEIALFRIAQEAVANAAKHAKAQHVRVAMGCARGRLRLSVTDDGGGFEPTHPGCGGLGLTSMRDRAEAVGADLRISSARGRTCVKVSLPVTPRQA
jgi:PAS domain S-box-containing protein